MSRRSPALTGPAPAPHPARRRHPPVPTGPHRRGDDGRARPDLRREAGLQRVAVRPAAGRARRGRRGDRRLRPLPGSPGRDPAGDAGRPPRRRRRPGGRGLRFGGDAAAAPAVLRRARPRGALPLAVVHRLPAVHPAGRSHRRRGPADRVGHGRGRAARGRHPPHGDGAAGQPEQPDQHRAAHPRADPSGGGAACDRAARRRRGLSRVRHRPRRARRPRPLRRPGQRRRAPDLLEGVGAGGPARRLPRRRPVGRARGRRHAHALLGQHSRAGRRPRRARAARGGGTAGRGRRGRAGAGQQRAGRPGAARPRQPGELRVAADRPDERHTGRGHGAPGRRHPALPERHPGDDGAWARTTTASWPRWRTRSPRCPTPRPRGRPTPRAVAAMAATAATAVADGSRPR